MDGYRDGIDESSLSLLAALGLSGAAGLNPWLPPLIVACAARADWIDVAPSWASITHTPVIAALFALFLLDFLADKVPVLDHALHAIGVVVQPAIGAGLFDMASAGEVPTVVALLSGGGVAGSIHLARASARPAVSGLSGGLGAPLQSLAEDAASLLLVLSALLMPIVAAFVVVLMLLGAAMAVWAAVRLRRRSREPAVRPGSS